ncbi:DUF3857 domain-containing protein [Flavobacterium sp.]
MKSKIFLFYFLLLTHFLFSQNSDYRVSKIADSLKQNANAVIRANDVLITITAQNAMTITTKVVTTVLNEYGLRNLTLSDSYDKNRRIVKIQATVVDAFGNEVKTYRKKDFRDVSVADGFSIFSDNRALYLDYTPTVYPFTIVFETQIETSNTAFIPSWNPVEAYYVSIEESKFKIKVPAGLKMNFKELNFLPKYSIEINSTENEINYAVKNFLAKKREDLAPSFNKIVPLVIFGLNKFSLEGIDGAANSWKEMGNWFYNKILNGTFDLPQETIVKINKLVENEQNPIKKAQIIYQYVQDKTRYVSIQEGIGGWKPMNAKDVDKLGYGDCKALTNYTRALLNAVGIESYYCRLYGQSDIREIHSDLVSFQSNHVILAIPNDDDYVWLECTSQIQPFGFQGDFTDDRSAFLIKPDGSEIVKTKTFTEKDNLRKSNVNYSISEYGMITANLKMISYGMQYDNHFKKERLSKVEQIKNYKEEFRNINNLQVKKIAFINDKTNIQFSEEVEIEADNYAQNTGGKLMFAVNAFNQNSYVPKKYKSRELPFEIDRGYTDKDEISVTIPEGYSIEAKPSNVEITTEFGSYKIEFSTIDNKKMICKRTLIINKGFYENTKFESYRKFRETIAKTDNSKILISKP